MNAEEWETGSAIGHVFHVGYDPASQVVNLDRSATYDFELERR
jgi:hypothetical protein